MDQHALRLLVACSRQEHLAFLLGEGLANIGADFSFHVEGRHDQLVEGDANNDRVTVSSDRLFTVLRVVLRCCLGLTFVVAVEQRLANGNAHRLASHRALGCERADRRELDDLLADLAVHHRRDEVATALVHVRAQQALLLSHDRWHIFLAGLEPLEEALVLRLLTIHLGTAVVADTLGSDGRLEVLDPLLSIFCLLLSRLYGVIERLLISCELFSEFVVLPDVIGEVLDRVIVLAVNRLHQLVKSRVDIGLHLLHLRRHFRSVACILELKRLHCAILLAAFEMRLAKSGIEPVRSPSR